MKKSFLHFLVVAQFISPILLFGQCPPPGMPVAGGTCLTAPLICENLDGYCATISSTNNPVAFPGCAGSNLNNDDWLAFIAGSTQISIQISPSNCVLMPPFMGLQGAIYSSCSNQTANVLDVQCPCSTVPFILESANFVVGQTYFLVLDGCISNVCDFSIDIISGSTGAAAPPNPGNISGPNSVCENSTSIFSLAAVPNASNYSWTLTPAIGDLDPENSPNPTTNITWTSTGTTQLCVTASNNCQSNPTQSCKTITVNPSPTAEMSGGGLLCDSNPPAVPVEIEFSGNAPWTFIYSKNNVNQSAITTSSNPYILQITMPGDFELISVTSGGCPGTVSGSAIVSGSDFDISGMTENSTCGLENGSINLSISGGSPDFIFYWSNGENIEDLDELLPGNFSVTVFDDNGCSATENFTVGNTFVNINISGNTSPNTFCGSTGNGSIETNISPADPNFQFDWSNGENTQNIADLLPGNYQITVILGSTCSETANFTVAEEPDLPEIDATTNPTICNLENGNIEISISGGVAPFNFDWSNGSFFQNQTDLAAGNYTVTVSGSDDCTAELSIFLENENPEITIFESIEPNTNCLAGNGSISIFLDPVDSPTGQPYQIFWSNGDTGFSIFDLPAGDFSVSINDAGCTAEANFLVENETTSPLFQVFSEPEICGASNGSIEIEIVDGLAPFDFEWSNGSFLQNQNSLAAGNYILTATDFGGCTATLEVEILNESVPPTATAVPTAEICGQNNGAINLTATTSNLPMTFLWSNNAVSEDLSGLPAGNFTATVTDFLGCSTTVSATVGSTDFLINISATTSPNTSCATPNGSIFVNTSPQNPPFGNYNFAWSSGETTQNLTNLAAGNYILTVSAGGNCTATDTFSVANQAVFPEISENISPTICNDSSGAIDLTISPAALSPCIFSWSNNSKTEDLTNLTAGNYTVTVTAANGCTVSKTENVPNNSSNFQISGTATPVVRCDSPNGSVVLTVSPPSGNYVFLWSNGATTPDLSGLSPGNFSVVVNISGSVSCPAAANFSVLDNRVLPSLSQNILPTTCGEANGNINLTVGGGQFPYLFDWSNGEKTQNLDSLVAGNYAVSVSDANGCSASATVNLPDNPTDFDIISKVKPNNFCPASGGTNGEIDLILSPPGNFSFAWSNNFPNLDQQNLPAGNYSITVTLGQHCTKTADFLIENQQILPEISGKISPDICNGGVGNIDLTTVGVAPLSFFWSNGAATEDLTNLFSGNFSVTATAANGCTATQNFSVRNNSNTFTFNGLATENTSCTSPNGTVFLTLNPSQPASGNYIFLWSNGATTQNLGNLPPGNFSVTISDGGTCSAAANFLVENKTPAPKISGTATDVKCFGEKTGAINFSISDGQPPYFLDWSPAVADPNSPQNLPAGNYNLTATDAVGCFSTANFSVAEPTAALDFQCQKISDVSIPGTADGGAQLFFDGGTMPYFFDWSPGGGQPSAVSGDVFDLNNLPAGNFSATATDANGCTATCDFQISTTTSNCQTAVGTMDILAKRICGNGCFSATYNPTGQILDADDGLQFILHTGSGTQILGEIARADQPNFCFDSSKMDFGITYFVSAVAGNLDAAGQVDLSEKCTVVAPGTPILFLKIPTATIAPHSDLNCFFKKISLAGSSDLPGASFSWSAENGGQISSLTNFPNILATAAGDFQLIISVNGCADTTTTSVADFSNLISAAILADPAAVLDCKIKTVNLSAEVSGSQNLEINWLANGTQFSQNQQITVEAAGIFSLVALDTLTFCSDTASLEILENEKYPPLVVAPVLPLTCADSIVILQGSSPIQNIDFQWFQLVGADTILVKNGATAAVKFPGKYLFFGRDKTNGCTNFTSQTVLADLQKPIADAGNSFILDCFSPTQFLDGSNSASGGGILQYFWTTFDGNFVAGNTSSKPEINHAGTYSLTVTDAKNGCTDTDEIAIFSNAPTLETVVVQPKCFGEKGSLDLSKTTGGTPPFRFSADGGSTFSDQKIYQNLADGDYFLVVQDALGCEDLDTTRLAAPPLLTLDLTAEKTLVLGETYQILANSNVFQANLASIVWTPTAGLSCSNCLEPLAQPTKTTRFKIEIEDLAGCRAADEILLKVVRGHVFVPNVFNPNSGLGNEKLTVFADPRSVKKVKSLLVFDRWGERVFENFDFQPNDQAAGWDGKFLGKNLAPAVFVWVAEVEFFDGEIEILSGDVLLRR